MGQGTRSGAGGFPHALSRPGLRWPGLSQLDVGAGNLQHPVRRANQNHAGVGGTGQRRTEHQRVGQGEFRQAGPGRAPPSRSPCPAAPRPGPPPRWPARRPARPSSVRRPGRNRQARPRAASRSGGRRPGHAGASTTPARRGPPFSGAARTGSSPPSAPAFAAGTAPAGADDQRAQPRHLWVRQQLRGRLPGPDEVGVAAVRRQRVGAGPRPQQGRPQLFAVRTGQEVISNKGSAERPWQRRFRASHHTACARESVCETKGLGQIPEWDAVHRSRAQRLPQHDQPFPTVQTVQPAPRLRA